MTDDELKALQKHTPGPWLVDGPDRADHGPLLFASPCGLRIFAPKGVTHIQVADADKTNVQAASAAPDLLRDLIRARELLREAERFGSFGPYLSIRNGIRAFLDGSTDDDNE